MSDDLGYSREDSIIQTSLLNLQDKVNKREELEEQLLHVELQINNLKKEYFETAI